MPRKERCKKVRENLLYAAASGTQKLNSFGFTTKVRHMIHPTLMTHLHSTIWDRKYCHAPYG